MSKRKHRSKVDIPHLSEQSQDLLPKSQDLNPKTGTLPVVGSQFCTPQAVLEFIVQKKPHRICSGGDITVNDCNGNLIVRADGRVCSFRDKRILRNASGKSLITLRRKILSINDKWEAFLGEKAEQANLLFSARTSCPLQLKTSLNVYMAGNVEEEQWNFKVKGDYLQRLCTFYYGARPIAQLSRKRAPNNLVLERDTFLIQVQPGVDYVFIVALVVILDEIYRDPYRE